MLYEINNIQEKNTIQLKLSSIENIPFQIYDQDFSFFVNGKEYQTPRIISDLLSPKICKIHSIDPTFNEYIINTHNSGDFSHIIQLINFN